MSSLPRRPSYGCGINNVFLSGVVLLRGAGVPVRVPGMSWGRVHKSVFRRSETPSSWMMKVSCELLSEGRLKQGGRAHENFMKRFFQSSESREV
jgi:hypothetical protein